MMLKYGDLQNPYLLAQAARAIFSVMDEDGSGCMDVGEVRKALKMLGIEQVC
jgi:Ca2+-binding EF-hand superfamily protein